MAKDETPTKGIPAAAYALIGTIITAMAGILVVYFQVIVPKELEIQTTQTAEMFHSNQTDTALARISTPTFTSTSAPATDTPTFTASPTGTPEPGTTFTPTFTITPSPTEIPEIAGNEYCINARSIYVREGPGMSYNAFGALTFQDCPFFDARNPDSSWIRISAGQPDYLALAGGWVRSDFVRPTDFDSLPVIQPTPTPTLSPTPTFTDTAEPSSTPTPTDTPQG